jgi:suppressor for copper-sensitivity B
VRAWIAAVLVAMATCLGAVPAFAAEWAKNESGEVGLIAATSAVGDATTLEMGLAFRLRPGWHIYWRNPGDAGYPPKIEWTGSQNVGIPVLSWPAPERMILGGLQNFGYQDQVVLPLTVPVTVAGQPVRLEAAVDYLACAQLCVPMLANLSLAVPAGPAHPTAQLHDLVRTKALVPGDGVRSGLTLVAAEVDGEALRLTVTAREPFDHPDAFVEPGDIAAFDAPLVTFADNHKRAVLSLPVAKGTLQRPLLGAPLIVTIVDGGRALEAAITPKAAAAPATSGLAAMLAVALLGGLILNLMPCVLPVLSIKILGAIGHGGAERAHVRASFLASAAGIVTSFLALAGAAVAVKAAGQVVGWGIQFQQPAFLIAMIVVLTLFAANLWGLFEIPLPSWLFDGAGKPSHHHTLASHFLSGAFATLLATPCSAPVLGTAIGFALARGPLEIMAIFAALGCGMSAPFLAVAVWPEAAMRLPKPGKWMLAVKKGMGLALAATALWLLTVLSPWHAEPAQHGGGIAWTAFDRDAIPRLVAEGRVVFVDVTADWCITCKVNKAAVIETGEVARRLGAGGTVVAMPVVAMKADWTRPDDSISAYLAAFGRYGIPFDVVYGPGAPDGIPLSELLSESETLAALDRAAKP